MASGTIISQTRTSDALLPVENVTVAYYEQGENGRLHLLAVRKSNSSGSTPPVILETPAQSASESPGANGSAPPFRLVDIMADSPGYERITANQVQVFDKIVTYQDFMMIPLPAPMEGVSPQEVFSTPAQNL